jgi:hypothetical protein
MAAAHCGQHELVAVGEGGDEISKCMGSSKRIILSFQRSVAVSSRQCGRCQLDMVNKLLIPAPLCGRSTPDRNFRAGVGVREPMFKTLIQEAVALTSLALFIAMIAIWTQVLGNL